MEDIFYLLIIVVKILLKKNNSIKILSDVLIWI